MAIKEIFKRSQLEENLLTFIGDDEQRRCIVHYDTPSLYYIVKGALFQLFNTNIAELDRRTMAQETNMSLLIEQARMFLMVGSTVLCRLADITFHDDHPVDRYLDVIAIGHNFFIIPFTRRFERAMMVRLSRDNSINGTVMLQRSNILINRMFTIQNLDFHTDISGIPFHRGTDTDTVISTRSQLEFETV